VEESCGCIRNQGGKGGGDLQLFVVVVYIIPFFPPKSYHKHAYWSCKRKVVTARCQTVGRHLHR